MRKTDIMTTLVIAEHDNISLKGSTLNTVKAASEISMFLDGQVHVLVVGNLARPVADAAARSEERRVGKECRL